MEKIYTDIAELCYNKDNATLYIKILENVTIDIQKAKEFSESVNTITNGENHFTLVDATNYFFIDDEALKFMALPEVGKGKMAEAYYSSNLANRLTMHFFKVYYKPIYPMQLFRKEEEALKWLKLV